MCRHDVEQGSEAWLKLRSGIPTASQYKRIVTSTGKPSAQADGYMYELLAQWLGAEDERFETEWMARGTELEPEARAFYEFETGNEVEEVGFISHPKLLTGCSPDGLVGDTGGIEIKCPKASTHVKYLLGNKCPSDYLPQVQGSMWITGRKTWDFISYHPDLDPLLVTVERDEQIMDAFSEVMPKFIDKLLTKRAELSNA